jgi:hypothetical protein
VALPDLSHLLLHEEDGPHLLHGLEITLPTRGFQTPAAPHLAAIPGRLGAVLAELPLREAGCLLPSWDDLVGLSQACHAWDVALHVDGVKEQLPIVADMVAWARAFAAELPSFIAVQPGVPHTNQFLAFAAGDADAVNERLLALIEERRIGLPAWRAAQEPGRIATEFAVSRAALKLDPAEMAALVAAAVAPSS